MEGERIQSNEMGTLGEHFFHQYVLLVFVEGEKKEKRGTQTTVKTRSGFCRVRDGFGDNRTTNWLQDLL